MSLLKIELSNQIEFQLKLVSCVVRQNAFSRSESVKTVPTEVRVHALFLVMLSLVILG